MPRFEITTTDSTKPTICYADTPKGAAQTFANLKLGACNTPIRPLDTPTNYAYHLDTRFWGTFSAPISIYVKEAP